MLAPSRIHRKCKIVGSCQPSHLQDIMFMKEAPVPLPKYIYDASVSVLVSETRVLMVTYTLE